MKRSWIAALFLVTLSLPATAAVSRYTQYLDDGATVIVDNASGWPNSEVWNLVFAADRSTVDDCVYTEVPYSRKGRFGPDDRILVTQHYLAWFDFTIGDAAPGVWSRSGELAGFWTLDPATHLFKYYRTGPKNCWNWPANELITGSANPYGYKNYWWDANSPAIEHSLGVDTIALFPNNQGQLEPKKLYYSFHHAQRAATGNFMRLIDGQESFAGVHYKQQGRMATEFNGPIATDVYDGNDSPHSGHYVEAQVEYICRPRDIISIFRFKLVTPPGSVQSMIKNNVNTGMWLAYAGDVDETDCDPVRGQENWPPEGHVTKRPRRAQFNQDSYQNWTGHTLIPAFSFVNLEVAPGCPNGEHNNWDVYTNQFGDAPPRFGSWMRFGYHDTLSPTEPRWQMTLLGDPNAGTGTYADPINIDVRNYLVGNEWGDATMWAGFFGLFDAPIVKDTWYQMRVLMQTTVNATRGDVHADGTADIVWHKDSGENLLWSIDPLTGNVVSTSTLTSTASQPAWKIVANGDFDGNGNGDLFWRNTSTGGNYVWFMNGPKESGTSINGADLSWSVAGSGDLNGDGKDDLIWRRTDGQNYLWLMNGASPTAIPLPSLPTSWKLGAVGDSNGDGKADLYWRDQAAGATKVWFMNGSTVTSEFSFPYVDPNWSIVACGDFGGDRKADLFWRRVDGANYLWTMNGTSFIATPVTGADPSWQVGAWGDFNSDGRTDLFWRHSSGANSTWLMNGATAVEQKALPTIADTTWRPASPR